MVRAQMRKPLMQELFVSARHAGKARQQFDRQGAVGSEAIEPPLQIGGNANLDEPSDLHEVQMQELLPDERFPVHDLPDALSRDVMSAGQRGQRVPHAVLTPFSVLTTDGVSSGFDHNVKGTKEILTRQAFFC